MAFTTGMTRSLCMNTESFASSLAVVCALLSKDRKVCVSVTKCLEKMWLHDDDVKLTEFTLSRLRPISVSLNLGSE